MQNLLTHAEHLLRPFKANVDGRGVVSMPKRKQYPILEEHVNIVLNWISLRIDFGDSRSTYAIQTEIQYFTKSTYPVSIGSIVVVCVGLGNAFILDGLSLEIRFSNRLLLEPKHINVPKFQNLCEESSDLVFRALTASDKWNMSNIIKQEWEEKNFGFYHNLDEIFASPFLLGIFACESFVGFIVCVSHTDLSPLFFEIFPAFRCKRYASDSIRKVHLEMRGNLSCITSIPQAKGFWTKMGYKVLDQSEMMAKIC
jgi:hypothetical protein